MQHRTQLDFLSHHDADNPIYRHQLLNRAHGSHPVDQASTTMTSMLLPPAMPLFDGLAHLEAGNPQVNQYLANLSLNDVPDAGLVYELAVDWLLEQRHNENNYKTYRSELTTFLHWCFSELAISPKDLTRRIMMRYLDYCQAPPDQLIANGCPIRCGGHSSANGSWDVNCRIA